MRIAVNALAAYGGGSRTYLDTLVRAFAGRPEHQFLFFIPPDYEPEPAGTVRFNRPKLPSRTFRWLYEQIVLPWRVFRWGAHVLYAMSDQIPWVNLTPVVVAARDLDIYRPHTRRDSWQAKTRTSLLRVLGNFSLQTADGAVFETEAAERYVRNHGRLPTDSQVIQHGLFTENVKNEVEGMPFLLCVSAVYRHKNFETLFLALHELKLSRGLSIPVKILGAAYNKRYLEDLRRMAKGLNLEGNIEWLDYTGGDAKTQLFASAKALVFPSELESFGYPIIEAMRSELPLVLSDIPAFREVAGEAALYFPAHSSRVLAQAIAHVWENPETCARLQVLAKLRLEKYSPLRESDRLLEYFERIVQCAD